MRRLAARRDGVAELLVQPLEAGHAQSPVAVCRNNRMVGYQGLSVRSSSHLHSAGKGNSSATALPIAPARWATEVSTEISRSSCATTAAVSAKFCEFLAELNDVMPAQDCRSCSASTSFCTQMKSRFGSEKIWAKCSIAIERLWSFKCSLLPAQHKPMRRRPFCGSLSRHFATRSSDDRIYGMFAGIVSISV